MFKTGIRNIYRDFCRYVIPNSNAMKCKCFVDRFISANCSMKRLALSGKELRTQNSELRNLFNIKYEDFSNI